tara:strand:+ start:4198 stop:5226 length:1029 start_codon:yes stop_codon:yes gene_type:complete
MTDYSKYANKGLTGLVNLGNTCYLNSCMQILSHCHILNEIIQTSINNNKINNTLDSVLLIEWNNLRELMWSKNCIVSPNRFVNAVQKISQKKNKELFTGFVQNDFPEFLIFILECFHYSLKRQVDIKIKGNVKTDIDKLAKKCYETLKIHFNDNYSDIVNKFYGVQVTKIISINNSKLLSVATEPYCLINLSINKSSNTIYDCLDEYCLYETMSDENAWFNEKTNRYEDVKKGISFWNLPEILIIDLKRFDNNIKKINKRIDVPLTNLDLSKYVIGYNSDKYVYDLFGVSNHIGNAFSGHYTAFIKNANNKWYEFNDQVITSIENKQIITNNAYCFFFIQKK